MSSNIHRRHLTAGQKAMAAAALEPMYAVASKQRMREAGRSSAPGRPTGKGVTNPSHLSKARDQAAKAVGAGVSAVSQAKAIKRDRPDLAEKVGTLPETGT